MVRAAHRPHALPHAGGRSAAHAAICRELGVAFDFPGAPGPDIALSEITDSSVLAQFIFWCMAAPNAADRAFNITNSDLFRWSGLWPRLADYFGLQPGIVRPMKLERWMADKSPVWQRIAERHGLLYPDIADVAL